MKIKLESSSKPREAIRTRFVMSLVYLLRYIENTEDEIQRDVLKTEFYNVLSEAKLTEKEFNLFQYEANSIGL